jgi:EAL domain-containing protein (putative c-di-GMP-specific phosphodiesterase class I)
MAWTPPAGKPPRTAVNVSARQLDDRAFVRRVARVLEETGMPAERLVLEVTESVLLADGAGHEAVLSVLKGLGVVLSIDDFGTGHSSLAYLRRLPVDQLKVDRSFVEDVANHGDLRILCAVVRLAHDLGLEVVAEGVETPQELEVVRRLGCDVVQGYLLGHPAPPSALASRDRAALGCFDRPLGEAQAHAAPPTGPPGARPVPACGSTPEGASVRGSRWPASTPPG